MQTPTSQYNTEGRRAIVTGFARSIQKDPRELAWCDPQLLEVIHRLQHHFPSAQGAQVRLQHLHYGDTYVKLEVCRVGGIKHLVDLLDHRFGGVQQNASGTI